MDQKKLSMMYAVVMVLLYACVVLASGDTNSTGSDKPSDEDNAKCRVM